jgi:hypothetical protein
MKPPVRIKLYGLVTVTKRGYLAQLAAAALMLAALVVIRAYVPPVGELARQEYVPAAASAALWFLTNLHWIALALAALFAVEAFFVLRRFAREEAKQPPAAAPAGPAAPPG